MCIIPTDRFYESRMGISQTTGEKESLEKKSFHESYMGYPKEKFKQIIILLIKYGV